MFQQEQRNGKSSLHDNLTAPYLITFFAQLLASDLKCFPEHLLVVT